MPIYGESFPLFVIIASAISVIVFILVRIWGIKKRNYWKTQKVNTVDSTLLLGHFARSFIFKKPISERCQEIYSHESVRDQPLVGVNIFHKPAILIRDPVLIKRILKEDGSCFSDG